MFLEDGFQDSCEILFSNENGEFLQAVKNKFNRIVVWNSSLSYLYKPPAFDDFKRDYGMLIKMTRDPKKFQHHVEYVKVCNYNVPVLQKVPEPGTKFPEILRLGRKLSAKFCERRYNNCFLQFLQ